jgi:hypothetical protein
MNIFDEKIGYKKLNQNTSVLMDSCSKLNDFTKTIDKKYADDVEGLKCQADSSLYWKMYNTFLFPYPGFHELFQSIRSHFFSELGLSNDRYYIQSWLNWYTEGKYIDWHSHSQSNNSQFMSGYYCVSGNDTITSFKFEDNTFDVVNQNDYLIYTKMHTPCVNYQHRTWPVEKEQSPRVTIAFEILHESGIEKHFSGEKEMHNHWIPL